LENLVLVDTSYQLLTSGRMLQEPVPSSEQEVVGYDFHLIDVLELLASSL
jgi:hypothetical protein